MQTAKDRVRCDYKRIWCMVNSHCPSPCFWDTESRTWPEDLLWWHTRGLRVEEVMKDWLRNKWAINVLTINFCFTLVLYMYNQFLDLVSNTQYLPLALKCILFFILAIWVYMLRLIYYSRKVDCHHYTNGMVRIADKKWCLATQSLHSYPLDLSSELGQRKSGRASRLLSFPSSVLEVSVRRSDLPSLDMVRLSTQWSFPRLELSDLELPLLLCFDLADLTDLLL